MHWGACIRIIPAESKFVTFFFPSLSSCIYGAAGCSAAQAKVEKIITDAHGTLNPCGSNYGGLDAQTCTAVGNLVYNTKTPDPSNPITLAMTASVCSPKMPAVFALPQYANYSQYAKYVGPCSQTCNFVACGLSVLCPAAAQPGISAFQNASSAGQCAGSTIIPCSVLIGLLPTGAIGTTNAGGSTVATTANGNSAQMRSDGTTPTTGSCEALVNGTCQQCHARGDSCIWCMSARRCLTGGNWLGIGDIKNATGNLFNWETECGDWQFGQCFIEGRLFVIGLASIIGLLLLVIVGVAICCCCMCRKRRNQSKSYSLLLNDDKEASDGVALLANQDTRGE